MIKIKFAFISTIFILAGNLSLAGETSDGKTSGGGNSGSKVSIDASEVAFYKTCGGNSAAEANKKNCNWPA